MSRNSNHSRSSVKVGDPSKKPTVETLDQATEKKTVSEETVNNSEGGSETLEKIISPDEKILEENGPVSTKEQPIKKNVPSMKSLEPGKKSQGETSEGGESFPVELPSTLDKGTIVGATLLLGMALWAIKKYFFDK